MTARALPILLRDPDDATQDGVLRIGDALDVAGPLVSCVMVSRGALFPAAFAIRCFAAQTYANRELVIVSAAADDALERYVAEIGDARIRYIRAPSMTIGELRNRSVAHAHGEFICQWDDDDLCAPDRIALMAAAAMQAGAAASFLHRVTLWRPDTGRMALSGPRPWENSMFVSRDALPIYPAISRREDTAVAQMISSQFRIALLTSPETYVYVWHGANLWPAEHFEMLLDAGDGAADGDALGQAMPLADYAAAARRHRVG